MQKCFLAKNDSWIWIFESNQQNIYGLSFFLALQYFVVFPSTAAWLRDRKILFFIFFLILRLSYPLLPLELYSIRYFFVRFYHKNLCFSFQQNIFIVFWWNHGSNENEASIFLSIQGYLRKNIHKINKNRSINQHKATIRRHKTRAKRLFLIRFPFPSSEISNKFRFREPNQVHYQVKIAPFVILCFSFQVFPNENCALNQNWRHKIYSRNTFESIEGRNKLLKTSSKGKWITIRAENRSEGRRKQ